MAKRNLTKLQTEVEEIMEPTIEQEEPVETKIGIVTAARLNVRLTANKTAEVLKVVEKGYHFEIVGEIGDFYKTTEGFVMKEFVEL